VTRNKVVFYPYGNNRIWYFTDEETIFELDVEVDIYPSVFDEYGVQRYKLKRFNKGRYYLDYHFKFQGTYILELFVNNVREEVLIAIVDPK